MNERQSLQQEAIDGKDNTSTAHSRDLPLVVRDFCMSLGNTEPNASVSGAPGVADRLCSTAVTLQVGQILAVSFRLRDVPVQTPFNIGRRLRVTRFFGWNLWFSLRRRCLMGQAEKSEQSNQPSLKNNDNAGVRHQCLT